MKTIKVANWAEFEAQLLELQTAKVSRDAKRIIPGSHFLFRGHADSTWLLKTTLDRFKINFSVEDYYRLICRVKPEIEAFSERKWEIMELEKYREWLANCDGFYSEFPAYEYMVYLRHHGFPSPLLDWTRSPYIAAFFAFNNFDVKSEMVSVYVYQEHSTGGKAWTHSDPHIHARSPYVATHKRHFMQKSEYTICVAKTHDTWSYARHEDTFSMNMTNQDILWKFNIPAREKTTILKKLDEFNLNSFSLFGTEESLMSTMAIREFVYNHDQL